MKTRVKFAALLALGLPVFDSAVAHAGPLARFWDSVVNDTVQSNIWPKQFIEPDRRSVQAPFCTMVANGWRMQNTLDDHHFAPGTNHLTEAGQIKVREILTQYVTYKSIFVLEAEHPEDTHARIESVRNYAAQVCPGVAADVMPTLNKPRGTPGEAIDDVRNRYRESMPIPRLPETVSEESP